MITGYFDFFSYWVFLWFILYYFGLIEYNPTFSIFVCLIIVFGLTFFWFAENKITQRHLIGFLASNIICKIMPLTLLWIKNDLEVRTKDVFFTIGLYLIYHLYLYLKGTSFTGVYLSLYKDIKCI